MSRHVVIYDRFNCKRICPCRKRFGWDCITEHSGAKDVISPSIKAVPMQSGIGEWREKRSDYTIRVSPKLNTYKAFQGQIIVWTDREIGIDAPPSLASDVDVLYVKAIDAFPYRDTLEEFLLRPCPAKP